MSAGKIQLIFDNLPSDAIIYHQKVLKIAQDMFGKDLGVELCEIMYSNLPIDWQITGKKNQRKIRRPVTKFRSDNAQKYNILPKDYIICKNCGLKQGGFCKSHKKINSVSRQKNQKYKKFRYIVKEYMNSFHFQKKRMRLKKSLKKAITHRRYRHQRNDQFKKLVKKREKV